MRPTTSKMAPPRPLPPRSGRSVWLRAGRRGHRSDGSGNLLDHSRVREPRASNFGALQSPSPTTALMSCFECTTRPNPSAAAPPAIAPISLASRPPPLSSPAGAVASTLASVTTAVVAAGAGGGRGGESLTPGVVVAAGAGGAGVGGGVGKSLTQHLALSLGSTESTTLVPL